VNRATLHLAPLLGVWMLLLLQGALAAQPVTGAASAPVNEPSASGGASDAAPVAGTSAIETGAPAGASASSPAPALTTPAPLPAASSEG
jgi:hypothetical protein